MTLHFETPQHEEAFRQLVFKAARFAARALIASACVNPAYLHPHQSDGSPTTTW